MKKVSIIIRSSRGVTLIELIVVAVLISLLAAAIMATMNPFEQFKKTNDAKRKSDLAQIQRALEAYYQDHGNYPRDNASQTKCNDGAGGYLICEEYEVGLYRVRTWGGSWSPYMNTLPKDPNSDQQYLYKSSADQQQYWIFTSVERGNKDSQVCKPNGSKCTNAPNPSFGSCGDGLIVCNYGVSSPNTAP